MFIRLLIYTETWDKTGVPKQLTQVNEQLNDMTTALQLVTQELYHLNDRQLKIESTLEQILFQTTNERKINLTPLASQRNLQRSKRTLIPWEDISIEEQDLKDNYTHYNNSSNDYYSSEI